MPSIEQLMQLLSRTPEDDFVLYALAIEHAKCGEHDSAITFFDRAIAADPSNAYHHFHKARSLEAIERIEEAKETLRTGLRVAKEHGDRKASSELRGYLDMIGG
ncbi:MAG: tetratricopeptide repeat protein [Phycisphaerales bacterium]|nr:tetratricopeptide repeat protein [Phycisphaerales bacterium]